jgi:hypothetical protein
MIPDLFVSHWRILCYGETRSQLNPDKPGQSGLYLRPVSFEKILRIGQSRPGHESNSYSSDRLFAI